MNNNRIAGLFVIATASVLAACASQTPVKPAVSAASAPTAGLAATAGASASSTAALASDKTPTGYRRVVKNGVEYFCSREGYTGSRTETFQQCLTKAQLTALRERDQDFVRRQQNHVGEQFSPSANNTSPTVSAASP